METTVDNGKGNRSCHRVERRDSMKKAGEVEESRREGHAPVYDLSQEGEINMEDLGREDPMKARDQAAREAGAAIPAENAEAFKTVAAWWSHWYRRTGHKRLARLLLQYRDIDRK